MLLTNPDSLCRQIKKYVSPAYALRLPALFAGRHLVSLVAAYNPNYQLVAVASRSRKGLFELPGGKLEDKDFDLELDPFSALSRCATRECFEESGVKLDTVMFRGTLAFSSWQGIDYAALIFLAAVPFSELDEATERQQRRGLVVNYLQKSDVRWDEYTRHTLRRLPDSPKFAKQRI